MLAAVFAAAGGFFGSALSAICGFGIGIFTMIMLPYAIPAYSASCVVGLVSIIQAVWLAYVYRKKIRLGSIIPPLAAYFVITLIMVPLIRNFSPGAMKRILGIFLVLTGIYLIFFSGRIRVKINTRNGLIAGAVTAVLMSMFSIGGPPMSLFYGSAFDDKEEYMGTMNFFYGVTNIYLSTLRVINGYVDGTVLRCLVWATVGMTAGTLIGRKIFTRLNADGVRKCSYGLMFVSGLIMAIE